MSAIPRFSCISPDLPASILRRKLRPFLASDEGEVWSLLHQKFESSVDRALTVVIGHGVALRGRSSISASPQKIIDSNRFNTFHDIMSLPLEDEILGRPFAFLELCHPL